MTETSWLILVANVLWLAYQMKAANWGGCVQKLSLQGWHVTCLTIFCDFKANLSLISNKKGSSKPPFWTDPSMQKTTDNWLSNDTPESVTKCLTHLSVKVSWRWKYSSSRRWSLRLLRCFMAVSVVKFPGRSYSINDFHYPFLVFFFLS